MSEMSETSAIQTSQSNTLKSIVVYTDGACKGNPGPGGWGALLRFGGQQKELFGGEKLTPTTAWN